MQPIYEPTWRLHLETGMILEEDLYGDYRLIGVEVAVQGGVIEYKYRLLFFPMGQRFPVLAVNLERNTFAEAIGGGAYFIGIHDERAHYNLGYALEGRADIDYDLFREVAFEMAANRLGRLAP